MFRAVADGRIKALWIMATNPVVSMQMPLRELALLHRHPRCCPLSSIVSTAYPAATTDLRRLMRAMFALPTTR